MYQGSLFGLDEVTVDTAFRDLTRHELDDSSWVDHCAGWLNGSDRVLDELIKCMPWTHRQVPMYDRIVDEPRLSTWWRENDGTPEALPVFAEARRLLCTHYEKHFDSIGYNYYRDEHDSVAWHGDRHRHEVANPVVAIIAVGEPRPFRLRPAGGGASITFPSGHGDLLVMGGACQHRWEHCVPKQSGPLGPRISISYRHGIVRFGRRRGSAGQYN